MTVGLYQYYTDLKLDKLQYELTGATGVFIPQEINRFSMKSFNGGTLPVGAHIFVTGKRSKA